MLADFLTYADFDKPYGERQFINPRYVVRVTPVLSDEGQPLGSIITLAGHGKVNVKEMPKDVLLRLGGAR
jgi:hypothetical protein